MFHKLFRKSKDKPISEQEKEEGHQQQHVTAAAAPLGKPPLPPRLGAELAGRLPLFDDCCLVPLKLTPRILPSMQSLPADWPGIPRTNGAAAAWLCCAARNGHLPQLSSHPEPRINARLPVAAGGVP